MSNFRPGPGQYDPTELERTILQEEIRRRAMHQGPFPQLGGRDGQPHPPPPPPTPGVAQSDYAQHISMLQRQQQQQQQQVPPGGYPTYVHSPYARNPYTGIADARAAAAAAVYQQQAGVGANGQLSQMYAHHERQRHQHQQQQQAAAAAAAAVGGYGAATYGPGVATPPAMDHHHHYAAAAYGIAAPPPITSYARDPAYPGAPNGGSPSPHDIALMQHQHLHPQHLHPSPPPPESSQASNRNSGGGSGSKQQLESTSAIGYSTPNGSSGGKPGTQSSETTPDKDDESPFDKGNLNDSSQRTTDGGMVDGTVSATPVKSRQISPKTGSSGKKSISSSSSKEKTPTPNKPRITVLDGTTIIEDGDQRWYTGCVPLGLDDDKYWLSELQVVLRAHFAEAFGATEDDIAAPMHGRNKPIALGQVGIRCMHCKHVNPAERGQQATSYPSLISGIYNSVQQMLRLHLDCCLSMPSDVRAKIEQLKSSCSSRGGRKQYWIDSAKRLGLVDTPHGIHFGRDPNGPLPPLTGPSVNSKEGRIKKKTPSKSPSPDKDGTFSSPPPADAISSEQIPIVSEGTPSPQQKQVLYENEDVEQDEENENQCQSQVESSKSPPTPPPQPPADSRPLVFPEDKSLISDYLYLTLEQMAPCLLMEADRVGCYKTRKVGFPGLACKHCVGQAGCGRYFPASEASLSQTTTSQTIMNHVRNCRRCPIEIRENLEIMKRNRMGPDGKRADKPKHGGRKVFFHRLWCRIQELPLDENIAELKEDKKRKSKSPNQRKKQKSNDDDDDNDSDIGSDDDNRSRKSTDNSDDAETESEDDSENSGDESEPAKPKPRSPKSAGTSIASVPSPKIIKKTGSNTWYAGCVRLTKADDPHWLTEMECFARSDLIEVFSYREGDPLDGYAGRRDPSDGQVGIRCVFCKALDPPDRINGCVTFPDSMSQIHARVTDMIRLHFPSCPSMPDGAVHTFKSYRGFDAKVANEDSAQYWVDSARDIGLANLSPMGPQPLGAWGIAFRRDPLQPSPADELDLEQSASNGNIPESAYCRNSLVRLEDRGFCTDQVMLLLRQVRPCRFQASDRRAGPGSRGRDRIMGFPGLCCLHCVGQNTLGRYFPVSAKNLTDSTTNSLQAHVASCAFCPEPIKASLAYLGHRSILQKAELSGSWKKAFFKKVWDRLHVEREWTSIDDEHTPAGDTVIGESAEHSEQVHHGDNEYGAHDDEEEGAGKDDGEGDVDGDAGSESDREDLGDNMNALIQAAAIWLTEQDNAEAKGGSRAKKTTSTTTVAFGRNTVLPTAKRRRVHF